MDGAGIGAGNFGTSDGAGGRGVVGGCCPHANAAESRRKENLILLE
jgi:hypothetical protein